MTTDRVPMRYSEIWYKPVFLFVLAISVVIVYAQVGQHDFVSFDDGRYVYENSVVSQGLTWEGLRWAFGFTDVAYWHPVTWLSHMLDCELFGLDPGPPHLINALLHLINTLLVFCLLMKMTGAYWKSLVVAALFALHPMNVESVAWLAERKNLLSTFFALATLLLYVSYKHSRSVKRYIAALFLYTASLMAKPSAVVLPILMLLMDYWPLKMTVTHKIPKQSAPVWDVFRNIGGVLRTQILEKLPFVVLAVLTTVMASSSLTLRGIDITMEAIPLGMRIANAIISINRYLGKLFWPVDLIVFYPYPNTIPVLSLFLALIVITGISILTLLGYRKIPFALFGWGWFLISLTPMIGLKQAGLWPALADRWAYVPYIGLFILLVWGFEALWVRYALPQRTAAVVGIIVLGFLAASSFQQVTYWQNSMTLFQHAVAVDPENDVAHNNLGATYYQAGKPTNALYHFIEALRIQPGYQAAHENLDTCLVRMGYGDRLQKKLGQLIDANPGMPALYFHSGMLFEASGHLQDAEGRYEQALHEMPVYVQALNAMCRVLMKQKKYPQALAMLKRRAAIAPVNAAVYYEIARIYAHFGETENALNWLKESLEKGFDGWQVLDRDPMLENLRENPVFVKMRRQ